MDSTVSLDYCTHRFTAARSWGHSLWCFLLESLAPFFRQIQNFRGGGGYLILPAVWRHACSVIPTWGRQPACVSSTGMGLCSLAAKDLSRWQDPCPADSSRLQVLYADTLEASAGHDAALWSFTRIKSQKIQAKVNFSTEVTWSWYGHFTSSTQVICLGTLATSITEVIWRHCRHITSRTEVIWRHCGHITSRT
jgi:hypothetical protein